MFDVDTTSFPTMRAKFMAVYADGKVATPTINDISIFESGTRRTVTSVSCDGSTEMKSVSAVLVMDVSASMGSGRLDSAKLAAKAWISALPTPESECAIVAFNNVNSLVIDFTSDRTRLHNAIDNLNAGGGTSYEAALIEQVFGGLLVAKRAKYLKSLIVVTDGMPNRAPDTSLIIAEARRQSCAVYSVYLSMPGNRSLNDICSATGGLSFEFVSTYRDALSAYLAILAHVQSATPCEIEWLSDGGCKVFRHFLEIQWEGQYFNSLFRIPRGFEYSIEVQPKWLKFGGRTAGLDYDTTISITAINADAVIQSITSKNGLTVFRAVNTQFPLRIPKDSTRLVTIRYSPTDSSLISDAFVVDAGMCSAEFSCLGGSLNRPLSNPRLKLLHPNGGEELVVGADTVVTWDGISQSDTVTLKYSVDSGKTWITVSDRTFGLKQQWNNVPWPTSDSCVMRVYQTLGGALDDPDKPSKVFGGHRANVVDMSWSPDGTEFCSIADGTLLVWDPKTGRRTAAFECQSNGSLNAVSWSPDGTRIAVVTSVGTVFIVNVSTKTVASFDDVANRSMMDVSWSPDSKQIAICLTVYDALVCDATTLVVLDTIRMLESSSPKIGWRPNGGFIALADRDYTIKLFDDMGQYSIPTKELTGHTSTVSSMSWSPDGRLLATGSADGEVFVWNVDGGGYTTRFKVADSVTDISWSSDGSKIATGSFDNKVRIWNSQTGAKIDETDVGNVPVGVAYSTTDGVLATTAAVATIRIWNGGFQNSQAICTGHRSPMFIDWSSDGDHIASFGSKDSLVNIWDVHGEFVVASFNIPDGVTCIKWQPKAKAIATTSDNGNVSLWNTDSGTLIGSFGGHNTPGATTMDLEWDPSGTTLYSGGADGAIKGWDSQTGVLSKYILNNNSAVHSLSISPDGRYIAAAYFNGAVSIWNLTTEQLVHQLQTELVGFAAFDVEWSPDGTMVAAIVRDRQVQWTVSHLLIWDASSGDTLSRTLVTGLQGSSGPIKISWNIGSSQIAVSRYTSGDGQRSVAIFDLIQRSITREYKCIANNPDVAFDPTGTFLAASGDFSVPTNAINIWGVDKELQADTSDALFRIVAPVVAARDVDMGQSRLADVKDSVVTRFINNTGRHQCRIDSIYFTGADVNAFRLVSGIPPFITNATDWTDVEFRFEPLRLGLHVANIVVIAQHKTFVHRITGIGIRVASKIVAPVIDFGKVLVGRNKDTIRVASVQNIGTVPFTFDSIQLSSSNTGSYRILSDTGAFVLQPAEVRNIDVRFSPAFTGYAGDVVQFFHSETTNPDVITLTGEGVLPDTARYDVKLNHIESKPGEHVRIELTVEGAGDTLRYTEPQLFTAAIQLNQFILHFTSSDVGCVVQDSIRCITSLSGTRLSSTLLVTVDALATLGNTDWDELTLLSFEWTDATQPYSVTLHNGSIRIVDLCEEGGTRLFVSGTARYSLVCRPNPASETTNIVYGSAENTSVTIEVRDFSGRLVSSPLQSAPTSMGEYSLPFDTSTLSAGTYTVHLRTSNAVMSTLLIITR